MSTLCLAHVTGVTLSPPRIWRGAIRIQGDRILEAGPEVEPQPSDQVESLGGAVVMPALVVSHHHLYSALARGMPAPPKAPGNFPEILERIWWVLDRALDPETVEVSALAGILGAVRCGAGAIVDHHASPNAIAGSLDRIGAAFEAVGVRGILCYETSDRWGHEQALAGVEENRRFARSAEGSRLLRPAVGAHASFTLADETLTALAEAVEATGAPLHVHLLEDRADRTLSLERYGAGPVQRFARAGLLQPGALFAHGVHLEPSEIQELARSGAVVLHNPRSNMNNRVGRTPLAALLGQGVRVALGTDGIDGDMLTEARAAFFRAREDEPPPPFDAPIRMLAEGHRILSERFGLPFGRLEPGAPADLTVLAYRPPTPLTAENLAGHLFFGGLGPETVDSVLVAGRWVLRHGSFETVDEGSVLEQARQRAKKLWEAMERTWSQRDQNQP